jgi:hypothetical protein
MTSKAEREARAASKVAAVAAAMAPVVSAEAADEIRLARLHLRVGMLSLALAELEDLEHRRLLSGGDRALLAEIRWRTGDTDGAADAARAHLDAGGDEPIALVIAAEATAADGRPGEARSLMDRLGLPDATTLDTLFAGMPRRAFWPSAPPEPTEEDTLFGELAGGTERAAFTPPTRAAAASAALAPTRSSAISGPAEVLEATSHGLWPDAAAATLPADVDRDTTSEAPAAAPASRQRQAAPSLQQDPVAELALAREELESHPERAFLRLALILRLDPTLAPAVLDAIVVRTEPAAAILRGDAQRLLGRHLEAEAAFASAADGLAATLEPRS